MLLQVSPYFDPSGAHGRASRGIAIPGHSSHGAAHGYRTCKPVASRTFIDMAGRRHSALSVVRVLMATSALRHAADRSPTASEGGVINAAGFCVCRDERGSNCHGFRGRLTLSTSTVSVSAADPRAEPPGSAGGLDRSAQHFLSSCSEGSGRGGSGVEAHAGSGRRGLGAVAVGSGGEGLVARDAGEPVDGAGPAASHRRDPAGAKAAVGSSAVAGRAGGDLSWPGGGAVAAGDRSRSGRSPSTVSREVLTNGGRASYRATAADRAAWSRAARPKSTKLAMSPALARAGCGQAGAGLVTAADRGLAQARVPR